MHKHPLPRDLHLIAQYHAVRFVEAIGQRSFEFALAIGLEWLARPERETGSTDRHCTGDAFGQLVRSKRDQITDPELVGEYRTGREHLHPGDYDTIVVFANHAESGNGYILFNVKFRIARRLWRENGIGRESVIRSHELMVV
jgi:hypothetical protein